VQRTMGMISAVALCLVSVGCQNPVTPSLSMEDLLTAPFAIEIAGRQFTIETALYRDFMPGDHADGSALFAVVLITATDGQPFPAEVDSTRLWVVYGKWVWETDFQDEIRPRDQAHLYQLEKVARDGPKWDVGAQVDVIVRVAGSTGSPQLLRATGQVIQAVM
jgi:hypothetical protein